MTRNSERDGNLLGSEININSEKEKTERNSEQTNKKKKEHFQH